MLKLTALTCLGFFLISCKQPNKDSNNVNAGIPPLIKNSSVPVYSDTIKSKKQNQEDEYYPFVLQDYNGQYSIVAELESKALYPKYYNFFSRYGYEGNGYCWEGHITQILEKLDNNLLRHINFDPEAGAFFATADSKENQLRFAELLSPIFSDMKKLEEWVKKADRSRIDD